MFEHEPRAWHEKYGDNPYEYGNYDVTDKPLRARAWTLQEREFSTKNIHFGKHQLLWDCRELKASAQLPWHHKKQEDDFEQPPLRDVATESVAPGGSAAKRDRWYGLVEDYTSRSLTKFTDEMLALAGLARASQSHFEDSKYLAGLWSGHLPFALLWRAKDDRGVRPPSYIAPTWSWASVKGPVSYESQRTTLNPGEQTPSDYEFGEIRVTEMNVSPKKQDSYGAINGAHLNLGGVLLAAIDPDPQTRELEDFSPDPELKLVLRRHGNTIGLLYPDAKDEIPYTRKLFCLGIRGEPYWSEIIQPSKLYEKEVESHELVMGLVLEEDEENESSYRRVGLARWVKKSIFAGCHPCSVRLN